MSSSNPETARDARDATDMPAPSALVEGQRARPLRALADALLAHASTGAIAVPGPDGTPRGALVALTCGRADEVLVVAPRAAGVGRALASDPRASVLVVSGTARVTLVGELEALGEDEASRARALAGASDDATALRLRGGRVLVRTATLGGWIAARA
jgi:hypothetical protein